MPVPKAAMDEDDLSPAGKDEVRGAGQIAPMQAKPETQRVNEPADDDFRFSILALDQSHLAAARRIGHGFQAACLLAGPA